MLARWLAPLFGLAPLQVGSTKAQPPDVGQTAESDAQSTDATADASIDASADDLDSLLNAADTDIAQLGNVNVAPSMDVSDANPVVEGVSKKAETLAESPGIVEVITADEIRGYGAKNLREVLERGTSIWAPNSLFAPNNVTSIRGDLPGHYDTHVLILLNGRPFKDTHQGGLHHAIYTAFPIATLARIEIIRGPGSVLYGTNAYVGVINLVTKNPVDATDEVSALAGSLGTQRYEITNGAGSDQQSLYVGAMYLHDDGFDFSGFDERNVFDSKLFGQENIGLVSVYDNGPFRLNTFVAQANETMMGNAIGWWLDQGFLMSTRVFCDAGYTIGEGEDYSLESHFTYNYSDGAFWGVPGQPKPEHLASHDYLIEPILRAKLSEDLELLVGGTTEFRQGHSRFNTTPEYSKIWYSAYAQLDYHVTDWLILVGGMQGNMPGTIRGGIVPRAGAVVSLTDHWTLKALYGSAFRSPAAIETDINVAAIVGNPDLAPETIDTFDGQLAYSQENMRLAATYFHSDYSDLVARDTTQTPPRYENLGTLEVQGVELEGRLKATRLQFVGSATWQENVNNAGVNDATHVPNWMVKAGPIYETPWGLTASVFDSYFSAPGSVADINPAAAIVNPVPDDYHLMSFNSRLNLGQLMNQRSGPFEVQFLIQNLLDEDIWHPEFSRRRINSVKAQAGRTFYGGISMQF